MPARSESSSPEPDRKKKSKKDKKAKKEKAKDKDKKKQHKKAPDDSSEERGREKHSKRARHEAGPDMQASGLLDGDNDSQEEDPMPPPQGLPSRQVPPRGEPSRSRDEPREASRGGFGDGPGADGKGKGKGKEKGKEKGKGPGEGGEEQPKEEPNFEASGLLAVEDNAKNGIPLKFTVPAEARRPATKWRLYVFTKGNQEPKIMHIYKNVGYLFGKDRRVVDVPTDHQTCSKQHAVLHYRQAANGEVRPYIMDLESVNGTFLNGERIDPARYIQLKERDVLKFGMSSREFVLLHGGSANHIAIDANALRSPSED